MNVNRVDTRCFLIESLVGFERYSLALLLLKSKGVILLVLGGFVMMSRDR